MPNDSDATHRVVGQSHIVTDGTDQTVYEVGDHIAPSESALESHPDRFEELDADGGGDSAAEPPESGAEDEGAEAPAVGDMTVNDVREWAADEDDADAVRAALDAERDGRDRVTAVHALEDRLDDLTGEG